MDFDLNEREKQIFKAVIQDYIRTAEPVGSRTLSKMYGLNLSPATIRNIMADLEDVGLLTQPHTSAGRIPTQMGLRFYVDTILEVRGIPNHQQEAISQEFCGLNPEVDPVIKKASRVLSSMSRHIGIVVAPKFSRQILKTLQYIRLGERTILAILVGRSGLIQNRILETEEDLSQEDLDRFNNYLNDTLEGLTISEIRAVILDQMRQEKNQFDKMFSQALRLSKKVFVDIQDEEDVIINGQVNLLDYPEFSGVETMKGLFKTFEDKGILVNLLDKTLNAAGVQIFIGSENELNAMEGCTLIASRYTKGFKPLGSLGVIGPTRLNYSRIIPVVDFTARLVSQILECKV